MRLDAPTPVVGRLDGDNGMGFVVGTRAWRRRSPAPASSASASSWPRTAIISAWPPAIFVQALDAGWRRWC